MTTGKERVEESKKILEEIKNTPLFKEYVGENRKEMKEDDAIEEALSSIINDIGEKDLKDMPLLSKRIVKDVNEELENKMMYRINDVFDSLERDGKVTIGIELSDIQENIFQEMKQLLKE